MLTWLYKNKNHDISLSENIIVDLVKDLFRKVKIKKEYKDKVIFVVDELERCFPNFAKETLEVFTTFTGVECAIDNHTCEWDIMDKELLINNLKIIWIFDKKILTKSIFSIYGQDNLSEEFQKGFWNKYLQFEQEIKNFEFNDIFLMANKVDSEFAKEIKRNFEEEVGYNTSWIIDEKINLRYLIQIIKKIKDNLEEFNIKNISIRGFYIMYVIVKLFVQPNFFILDETQKTKLTDDAQLYVYGRQWLYTSEEKEARFHIDNLSKLLELNDEKNVFLFVKKYCFEGSEWYWRAYVSSIDWKKLNYKPVESI